MSSVNEYSLVLRPPHDGARPRKQDIGPALAARAPEGATYDRNRDRRGNHLPNDVLERSNLPGYRARPRRALPCVPRPPRDRGAASSLVAGPAVHPRHAPVDLAGLRNEAVRIDPAIRMRQRSLPDEGRNGSVRYPLLHPHAAPERHVVFDLLRGCLGFRVIPCGVVIHRFIHDNIVVARFPLPRTGRMGVAVPKEFTVDRFRRKIMVPFDNRWSCRFRPIPCRSR